MTDLELTVPSGNLRDLARAEDALRTAGISFTASTETETPARIRRRWHLGKPTQNVELVGRTSKSAQLEQVYRDRNLLALTSARLAEVVRRRGHVAPYAGWWSPTDDDDPAGDDWAVVYLQLPSGQASWHVPRTLASESSLTPDVRPWDGHDRETKNDRLRTFVETDLLKARQPRLLD